MLIKLKKIILKIDQFLFKKFGSYKSVKPLESIKEVRKIFSYLNDDSTENNVRFVGGCVRKAISGEEIDDIDLATLLEPQEVKKRLEKKEIKVFDSGISHGTVTAIINKKKIEITTLRKDISTDGRRANVQFTLDWKEDSSRRDFTINSIYSDLEGRIFDPQNGVYDLQNGLVKFIGLPDERIQEDYLRILRYLRFFSCYSKIDHDQEIISSIKRNINGLNKISNERIFNELSKILKLENNYKIFSNNSSKEIILNIFPQFKCYERLKVINGLDAKIKDKYDNELILALLIIDETKDYEYFCHKYKVSNNMKNRFKNIALNYENIKSKKFFSKEKIKKLIYLLGKKNVSDLLLFSICVNKKLKVTDVDKLLQYIKICEIPKFPISGDYLKKHGFDEGKILGKQLELLKQKWLNNNFVIDKKIIEKSLGKNYKN
tara:strand:- start:748 stop:2046 length:1299 start_codon:yes stop_codon:yes gene_type:complete